MPPALVHQYVDRRTGELRDEKLYSDRFIRWLYGPAREHAPTLFEALVGAGATRALGLLNYDASLGSRLAGNERFLKEMGVDLSECVLPRERLDTARKVFERQIRYEELRPMSKDPACVVCPADARALVGSFERGDPLFIKEKFFSYDELLGVDADRWLGAFAGGDFAVFRLTPDKYHYNHSPVSGVVLDFYEVDGAFHSCNPGAVVEVVTPYSKNKRHVTVIDTDVAGGTGVGLVAMIEVVAMMIGQIVQCYSARAYEDPRPMTPGLFIERGRPKSLYRPGSSTDIVILQRGRAAFAEDLVANLSRAASSRFSAGFGQPLIETDVAVRSPLAWRRVGGSAPGGTQ